MKPHRATLIAAALSSAAVLAASPAHAAPFVGTYRGVDVTYSVNGADGAVYNIDITATQAVASAPDEQALYLNISRCAHRHCQTIENSRTTLPAGSVNIGPDLASAQVTTSLHGIPITINAATQYIDVASGSIEHPGFGLYSLSGPSARTSADTPAAGSIKLGHHLSCNVIADIFSFQGVDTEDPSSRDPRGHTTFIPAGVLSGRHHPTCTG